MRRRDEEMRVELVFLYYPRPAVDFTAKRSGPKCLDNSVEVTDFSAINLG